MIAKGFVLNYRKSILLVLLLTILLASGCSRTPVEPPPQEITPTPTITPPPVTQPTPATERAVTLQIWLPPQFDPAGDNAAAGLLQARLDEFTAQRPRVKVEVRIKTPNGPGGLLDSLSTASAAAPLALPDLIALPRSTLEEATLKGLVFPIDGLTHSLEEQDWYGFAQQLGHLQTSAIGLPFAADALVMLYRPAEIERAPRDWESVLALNDPLVFPAADTQALFTLTQYLAAGGQVQGPDGRPLLEIDPLSDVLKFYQAAEDADVMPFWLTQYTTDDQAWEAYRDNRSNLAITWISRYLKELPADTSAAPLPTRNGQPFTLVDGWVWALPNPHFERHAVSIELAEHLIAGEFLGEWTAAAGYLPPRASALTGWNNSALRALVSQVAQTALITPQADVLAAISPALQQVTVEVLKEQADPQSAAQAAIDRLTRP
jgi:multiple sugar transport system substrate-binding protein